MESNVRYQTIQMSKLHLQLLSALSDSSTSTMLALACEDDVV